MCVHGVKGSTAYEVDHNHIGLDNRTSAVPAFPYRNGFSRRVNGHG